MAQRQREDLVADAEEEPVVAGMAVGAADGNAADVEFVGVGDGADGEAVGLADGGIEVWVVVGHAVLSGAVTRCKGPQDVRRSGSSRPP